MNYILIEKTTDPDIIKNIDVKNDVIICEQSKKNSIIYQKNKLYLQNDNSFEFYNQKITNQYVVLNFNPYIKWSLPIGVDLNFTESKKESPFILKIYSNYVDIKQNENNQIINNLTFTLYIDKDRIKRTTNIPAKTNLLNIEFDYCMDCENAVNNIYHIKNNFVYEEFIKHFYIN